MEAGRKYIINVIRRLCKEIDSSYVIYITYDPKVLFIPKDNTYVSKEYISLYGEVDSLEEANEIIEVYEKSFDTHQELIIEV